MARRGGNSDNPFSSTGLDWSGNSASNSGGGFMRSNDGDNPADSWGPDDACYYDHIDSKANKRKDKESKYTEEKTVLDTPVRASVARVKRTSAQAYEPDDWYKGPKEG
jgi:hypothetical protein